MKSFNCFQPTEIRFGCGRLSEVGQVVARYGKRCLIVSVKVDQIFSPLFERLKQSLKEAGVELSTLKESFQTRQLIL